MTEAEHRLWNHLRGKQLNGYHFRRQHPVGPFIVDFICLESKLAIEVDGSQHGNQSIDSERDEMLKEFGVRVLRFWNNDVLQRVDDVLNAILKALAPNSPHPPCGHLPPPQAGEG
jgi:very-short-patch-repair endonuclease